MTPFSLQSTFHTQCHDPSFQFSKEFYMEVKNIARILTNFVVLLQILPFLARKLYLPTLNDLHFFGAHT